MIIMFPFQLRIKIDLESRSHTGPQGSIHGEQKRKIQVVKTTIFED